MESLQAKALLGDYSDNGLHHIKGEVFALTSGHTGWKLYGKGLNSERIRHLSGLRQAGTRKDFQPGSHLNHNTMHPPPPPGPETSCPQPPSPLIVYSGQEVVSW